MSHPVLYSYRRCPFAMRARMGLYASGIAVEQREIVFWDKPTPMLQASPKGTVPVLVLTEGQVIDESLDILLWALQQNDPHHWLTDHSLAIDWIAKLDAFKPFLDAYKYNDQADLPAMQARLKAEDFLSALEAVLKKQEYLLEQRLTYIDIAIFPFIRQFAHVDKVWWAEQPYPQVARWLEQHLAAPYFQAIMKNRPVWQPHFKPLWLDEPELQTRNEFVQKAEAS